jgi:uncharacterized protein YecE (DUF72 family)
MDQACDEPAPRRVGTAGWALPAPLRDAFGDGASNLARYATRFDCVEVNSSFHRRHRASTWERWEQSTPDAFRFSAKLPKTITHVQRLAECDDLLADFIEETSGLGAKLAVILVQLPPKLAFDPEVARAFFDKVRAATNVQIVCEPRHASWFDEAADEMLAARHIARVAADPAPVPAAADPGGWSDFAYWRLHGSPRIYRSAYDAERIGHYASALRSCGEEAWCIFDNTASSAATGNALEMVAAVRQTGTG